MATLQVFIAAVIDADQNMASAIADSEEGALSMMRDAFENEHGNYPEAPSHVTVIVQDLEVPVPTVIVGKLVPVEQPKAAS